MLLLKSYITKVLEYKGEIIKFVCVAMRSLVMSLHSRDIPLIDIIIQIIQYNVD